MKAAKAERWRASILMPKDSKVECWRVEAKAHSGETQLENYDLHRNTAWASDKHPAVKKWKQWHWNASINNIVLWNHNINNSQCWNWRKWPTRNYSADWGFRVSASTLSSNSKIIDWEEVNTFSSSQSYRGTLGQI
jgi:hypothetical protein